MIEIIVTTCLATGIFLLVVTLPFRGSGNRLRSTGWALAITPLAASVAFGALREAIKVHPVSVGLGSIVGLILIVSAVAYVGVGAGRPGRRAGANGQPARLQQKRVLNAGRRPDDIVGKIREYLAEFDD